MADDSLRAEKATRFLEWLDDVAADETGGADEPTLIELAELAAAFADQAFERAGGPERVKSLDCKRGCAYCCHLPVETSAAEAFRALEYAWAHLSDDEYEAMQERVREAATAYPLPASKPPAENPPCPFLKNDACQVYPARPLSCRGWNSSDVAACKAAHEKGVVAVKVPVDTRVRSIYANASEALLRGLARSDRGDPVHLVPALAVLIEPL